MSMQWETVVTAYGSSRAAIGKSCETHIAYEYMFFTKMQSDKSKHRTKNTICAWASSTLMEGMKEQFEIARTNMKFRNKSQDMQPMLNLQELMRNQ
jgi:hypothetical protein